MSQDNQAYDKTHRLHQLVLGCVVVNEGQENGITELLYKYEVYGSYLTRGRGTSTSVLDEVTGKGQLRKVIVFAVMREDVWNVVKADLETRFAISKIAKGIAYCVPLTSVMSVSVYKMLGNIRFFESPLNGKKHKRKLSIIGGKSK